MRRLANSNYYDGINRIAGAVRYTVGNSKLKTVNNNRRNGTNFVKTHDSRGVYRFPDMDQRNKGWSDTMNYSSRTNSEGQFHTINSKTGEVRRHIGCLSQVRRRSDLVPIVSGNKNMLHEIPRRGGRSSVHRIDEHPDVINGNTRRKKGGHKMADTTNNGSKFNLFDLKGSFKDLLNDTVNSFIQDNIFFQIRVCGSELTNSVNSFMKDYSEKQISNKLELRAYSRWDDTCMKSDLVWDARLDSHGSKTFINHRGMPIWIETKSLFDTNLNTEDMNIVIFKTLNIDSHRKTLMRFIKAIHTRYNLDDTVATVQVGANSTILQKRRMDTIYLEQEKKDDVINSIQHFLNRRQWYADEGLPFHYGILLEGIAGTGKSSFIRAIATHFNMNVHVMTLKDFARANNSWNNCFIVFEDVDTHSLSDSRTDLRGTKHDRYINNRHDLEGEQSEINLGSVLNSIDGIQSKAFGCIFIMTTNHVEKLDHALIRPGRIDLRVTFGYVTLEILNQFMRHHYPDAFVPDMKVREKLSIAELQNLVLQQKSADEVLAYASWRFGDEQSTPSDISDERAWCDSLVLPLLYNTDSRHHDWCQLCKQYTIYHAVDQRNSAICLSCIERLMPDQKIPKHLAFNTPSDDSNKS